MILVQYCIVLTTVYFTQHTLLHNRDKFLAVIALQNWKELSASPRWKKELPEYNSILKKFKRNDAVRKMQKFPMTATVHMFDSEYTLGDVAVKLLVGMWNLKTENLFDGESHSVHPKVIS